MKIKIGVLDDELSFAEKLQDLLHRWAKEKECLLEIISYLSSETFFLDFESNITFDVMFLDIMMPTGPNGIDVAEIVRKRDSDVIIIFLTSSGDYMNEGYDVNAMQYLIKPIRYPKIEKYMDKAYDLLLHKKPAAYILKSKNSQTRIPFHDILYYTSSVQHIEIQTKDGRYKEWKRLNAVEPILPLEFVRCHRSFIVNIEAVRSIQPRTIVLSNNEIIPIGDSYLQSVKEKWMYYY